MSHRSKLIILKFGGASLGTPGRIRRAARRVASFRSRGHDVVVVVSAIGETTDRLLRLVDRVEGASDRELDRILATGEDLSAALLATAITARGRAARSLRGGEAGLIARGEHGQGELLDLALSPILDLLRAQVVPIVSGFQAVRLEDGETVTLGRGTSDLTAVFLAARLGAAECHLVKDVDGVYDVDPNRFGDARRHASLNYRDLEAIAAESQIVHAGAAALARESQVHLRIYGYKAPFKVSAAHCTTVGEAA
jgi:aspartate kinase